MSVYCAQCSGPTKLLSSFIRRERMSILSRNTYVVQSDNVVNFRRYKWDGIPDDKNTVILSL